MSDRFQCLACSVIVTDRDKHECVGSLDWRQTAEIERLTTEKKALMYVYLEARACAYMSGVREALGNTNLKCLRDRIEFVDELLKEQP